MDKIQIFALFEISKHLINLNSWPNTIKNANSSILLNVCIYIISKAWDFLNIVFKYFEYYECCKCLFFIVFNISNLSNTLQISDVFQLLKAEINTKQFFNVKSSKYYLYKECDI